MKAKACKSTQEQASASVAVKRDESGRYLPGQSGNPSGRLPGPTCHALRTARDAVAEVALPKLIEAAKDGNLDACRTLLSFGLPRLRPVSLPEPVDLPAEGSFTELMKALLALVSAGRLSTDKATEIASIIATAARVDEVTELREDVEHLRGLLEARGGEGGTR